MCIRDRKPAVPQPHGHLLGFTDRKGDGLIKNDRLHDLRGFNIRVSDYQSGSLKKRKWLGGVTTFLHLEAVVAPNYISNEDCDLTAATPVKKVISLAKGELIINVTEKDLMSLQKTSDPNCGEISSYSLKLTPKGKGAEQDVSESKFYTIKRVSILKTMEEIIFLKVGTGYIGFSIY